MVGIVSSDFLHCLRSAVNADACVARSVSAFDGKIAQWYNSNKALSSKNIYGNEKM